MPLARKSSKPRRRSAPKGRGRRMGRVPRPLKYNANRVGGANTCRISQTLSTIPILANTPYQIQVGGITGDRVRGVCEQFALYRIAKVVYKYKPLYDTFAPSAPAGTPSANFVASVPNLYWKMNRFADAPPAWDVQDLKDMGAKPFRFDDKAVTVAYKPNILLSVESGGSDSGQIKMTPWLNTDDASGTSTFTPSTTDHYGHFYYVECAQVNSSTELTVGTLDVTVYYEFKNPRVEWTPAAQGAKMALNPLKIVDSTIVS